jgi:hypothetical protein
MRDRRPRRGSESCGLPSTRAVNYGYGPRVLTVGLNATVPRNGPAVSEQSLERSPYLSARGASGLLPNRRLLAGAITWRLEGELRPPLAWIRRPRDWRRRLRPCGCWHSALWSGPKGNSQAPNCYGWLSNRNGPTCSFRNSDRRPSDRVRGSDIGPHW